MTNDMNNVILESLESAREMLNFSKRETYRKRKGKTSDYFEALGKRFDELRPSDLSNNDQIRLFCRQLKRLRDSNKRLGSNYWIGLDDYLIYALDPNSGQISNNDRKRFRKRITFEEKLERRQKEFQEKMKEQKSLHQLIEKYTDFLKEYLPKCTDLHSTLQVPGLVDNIDDFLSKNYGEAPSPLTDEKRRRLQKELSSIKIPLDYFDRSLEDKSYVFSDEAKLKKTINTALNNLLTPAHKELNTQSEKRSTAYVLKSERWLVILGDPGNGKTTLLRSIMHEYAYALRKGDRKIILGTCKPTRVRIPVLIRMSEFALWLETNSIKSLIDYIGEHTWFSKKYCQNGGTVLKEFIYHGHTLILLDGLDEIPKVGRKKVVKSVRKFIREYVNDPHFISAFDKKLFNDLRKPYASADETEPPSKSGGNQIIITSRFVGYDTNPIIGDFIKHYRLSSLDQNDVNKFVKKWMSYVERVTYELLSNEGVRVHEKTRKSLSQRRIEAMKSMFGKNDNLLFNSSLLTLICTAIFGSADGYHPQSRVEVYNHAVKATFHFWKKREPSISSKLIAAFLRNLSTYLHLRSPVGLIDKFDIKKLARLTVKEPYVNKNRAKPQDHSNKLLKTLKSNAGIVTDRGLDVFGFQHLSFQEYFVARSLVKRHFRDGVIRKKYSIEEIANRLLLHTTNPGFREPLLMALDWISWKWSSGDFDLFCIEFVRSSEKYSIPLGALFFFDALNEMRRLPSESAIFTALNSLLHYSSNFVAKKYFIQNLFKLPADIIRNWMSNYLKDDRSLVEFCLYLLMKSRDLTGQHSFEERYEKLKISAVFEQLYSFHKENTSAKFVVDQTLRRIMMLEDMRKDTFLYPRTLYPELKQIDISNIHPLILSVLIVVCGGVGWKGLAAWTICYWSHERMYCKSSIMEQIIEYLMNQEQSHLTKFKSLIKHFKETIERTPLFDTSDKTVDTFVALICLHKASEVSFIEMYFEYQALSMAFEKIKQAYRFITLLFHKALDSPHKKIETIFKETVKSIIDKLYTAPQEDNQQQPDCSTTSNIAVKKLTIQWPQELFLYGFWEYSESGSNSGPLNEERKQNLIEENRQSIQEDVQDDLSRFLTFVPLCLQKLYHCIFIKPCDKADSLPLVVFLAQCLIYFEDVNKSHPNFADVLPKLKSQCKQHMLENCFSVFLFKTMHTKPCDGWQKLIDVECQRILEVDKIKKNENNNCRLFAASICLARLSQVSCCSPSYASATKNTLPISLGEKVSDAIGKICDPILKIVALDMILEIKDLFIFDEKQRNNLDLEMARLLNDFRKFPLLRLTFIVARFYTQEKDLPMIPSMIEVIAKRFGEPQTDRDSKEAVLIVLKQLGHLYYLFKSFDPLVWNSSLLFRWFSEATSFDSLNTTFLSLLYLTELAFDAHLLQMYMNGHYKNKISYLRRLISSGISSSSDGKIMTYGAALWITNYLQKPSSADIPKVIKVMNECLVVEKKALAVIKKWLKYRNERKLRIFAHYAALQLFIEPSELPGLLDIINEIYTSDDKFNLNSLVEHIFNSRVDNFTIVRQILTRWRKNLIYASNISIWISRQKLFHSILELELERITQNENELVQLRSKSFLFIVKGCSYDIVRSLKQHLQTFIGQINANDVFKEQYVANVIQWILESQIRNDKSKNFSEELYKYVFTLLGDQSHRQVQKAILNSLFSVVLRSAWVDNTHLLMADDVIAHLNAIISSYKKYPEDVLAVCLLVYGLYLHNFNLLKRTYCVADEIQQTLTELFTSSATKITSIRAGLCLIFAKQSDAKSGEIPNWVKEERRLTAANEYGLLLQQTLFEVTSSYTFQERFVDYILSGSPELLNRFVNDLNVYLNSKCDNYYLSDPSPDYVKLAIHIRKENFQMFRDALKANSIDEKKFLEKLSQYAYYAKTGADYHMAVILSMKFGTLTEEVNQMLEWAGIRNVELLHVNLQDIHLHEVSDRKVIETLFEKLKLLIGNGKFECGKYILRLLILLAEVNVLSSLEIHQKVSSIVKELSHTDNFSDLDHKLFILDELLNLSSIENPDNLIHINQTKIFSENDIDFEFETKIDQLKRLLM